MVEKLIFFMVGAILWRVGGWVWKPARRYFLAAALTYGAWRKEKKWKVFLLFPLLIGAFSLGYGDDHPYWYKFLVGIAWILPAIILLGHWWTLIIPFIWVALFWLSNQEKTKRIFLWWWIELLTGGLVGLSYA